MTCQLKVICPLCHELTFVYESDEVDPEDSRYSKEPCVACRIAIYDAENEEEGD